MSLHARTKALALSSNSPTEESQYLAEKAREIQTLASGAEVAPPVRVRNRRARYLELHPEYFDSGLELADPLLYDRLIRRFQTASEREAEGRQKGYSGVLEADLYRGEAKLHALRHPDPNATISYRRGENGEILAEEKEDVPKNKEEGMRQWRYEMERRFLEGRDGDFNYELVDGDSKYDDVREEERQAEETWFEQESPEWVGEERDGGRRLAGETGVQDF